MDVSDSPSSPLPLPKAAHDSDLADSPLESPLDGPLDKASVRSSVRRSKARERDATATSSRELARLLLLEESQTKELQRMLYNATDQLHSERRRADDAERKALEATARFKDANDARIVAQQDCTRVKGELDLYKVALNNAQKEIFRAQTVLDAVEGRRREAEDDAAKARSKTRKLTEEKRLNLAREEGRKMGMQEGLEMGKDIGYLHGRSKGYAQGRTSADRVLDKILQHEDIEVEEYIDSRGPSPEIRGRGRGTQRYRDSSLESSGLAPGASSSADERPPPTRSSAFSPHRSSVDLVTDGWIPEADHSLRIHLPAPHELSRAPPTSEARSPVSSTTPTPPLPPLPMESVLMVPPPRPQEEVFSDGYASGTPRRPPRVRRRSSIDSVNSSRTSELELLSAPEYTPASRGSRASGLSVIPEVVSAQGTPSQVINGSIVTDPEQHTVDHGAFHMPMPTRAALDTRGLENRARQDIYQRPRSPSDSLPSTRKQNAKRASDQRAHRASVVSNGSVHITVVPPSRPASNNSQDTTPHSSLLSPADANRPIPLPSTSAGPTTPSKVPLPPTSSTIPMSLPEGGLPLGFIPSGPPVSPYSRGGDTAYSATGVPLPPSTIGSHHHRLPSTGKYTGSTATVPMPGSYNDVFASGPSDQPAVIPPRSAKYADSEDESVSSSISSSLTTPPARKINMVKASGDPYYRTPGSVRSSGSRLTGAGVPLPPSTVAGTPRTSHSHTPDTRHLHAGVTPANLHRTMSFSTERNASVRG